MMKKARIALLITVLLCLGTVCAAADGIAFDRTNTHVFENETLETVLNYTGDIKDGELAYTSANDKVLTIDENGVVTGLMKGKAIVRASLKTDKRTYTAELSVTVDRKAESARLREDKLSVFTAEDPLVVDLLDPEGDKTLPVLVLPLGKSTAVKTEVLPEDASSLKCALTAADEDILQVRGSSLQGKAAGETLLTVSNELSPEVCTVYRVLVVRPVTRLTVTADAASVAKGSTVSVTSRATPDDATVKGVSWSSANEKIAIVDENGLVTGVKRGSVRIAATALDGSGVKGSVNIKVVQSAEQVTLNMEELTLDAGKAKVIKATVLPKDTDVKTVIWSSSDETVARVDKSGRVTAISRGECVITCAAKDLPAVSASVRVTVQQPVRKIAFTDTVVNVYVGEEGAVSWTVLPEDATNKTLKLTSSNQKVVTVDEDGRLTPVKRGEAYINAVTTDGSNQKARVKVRVIRHVEGVHMKRSAAYVSKGETATCTAILEPKDAGNTNMTWQSSDPGVVSVTGKALQVRMTGHSYGTALVTGTTEDGGHTTSLLVHVGDYDHALRITNVDIDGRGNPRITVHNASDVRITRVTVSLVVIENDGESESGYAEREYTMTYNATLGPGENTREKYWRVRDFSSPMNPHSYIYTVVSYEIDNDWVKTIRTRYRPTRELPIHL